MPSFDKLMKARVRAAGHRFCVMNKLFLPTSRKVLSTFQTFCPVGDLGVQFAQTVVHLPTFKFRPGKGVFWGGVEGVLCKYILPKGMCGC